MSAGMQQRLVESLDAIGEYITIDQLRIRGNIAKPEPYLLTELEEGRRAGIFLQKGNTWGLARWEKNSGRPEADGGGRPPVTATTEPTRNPPPGNMQERVREMLAANRKPKDIAAALGIDSSTVAYHKRQLITKGLLNPKKSRTTKETAPARAEGDSMPNANDAPHPALEEINDVFEKLNPVTIEDAEPKLALLRKYAEFLKAHGAHQAEQLALQIHNDIATAAHLPQHTVQL